MRNKVLSWLLTASMAISLFSSVPLTAAAGGVPGFTGYGWSVYQELGGFTGFVEITPDSGMAGVGDQVDISALWMSGADFVGETLYAVSNADSGTTGTDLYTIDTATGVYTKIGNTGAAFQGFCYDTVTDTAYACSTDGTDSGLYTVDLDTGAATSVGLIEGEALIDIAADEDGNLYGLSYSSSKLYSIDKDTAVLTLIGSLGISLQYAQDIAYDRDNGVLYGTLYTTADGGGLYNISTSDGTATLLRALEAQVDAFAIPYNVTSDVCEVNGIGYGTLDAAIAASDGDTIKLLANINYSGGLYPTKDLYFNLNGYTLNVTNNAGPALTADGRDINISGEGELNVTGTTYGVYACDGGTVEITNAAATADDGKAVCVGDSYCAVTVYGNATANGANGVAVYSGDTPNCIATVYGDVTATGANGTGASAYFGGSIVLDGDINATNYINVSASIKTQAEYSGDENGYYVYSNAGSMVKIKHVVCRIGAAEYKWFSDALTDAADGDTITLLDDITYLDVIVLTNKDLTIDLDTYDLNIGKTNAEPALKVDGCTFAIDETGGGSFNIADGYIGVQVMNGGMATVSSISGLNGYGVITEDSGSMAVVSGDISVMSYMGKGFIANSGSNVHVKGSVYTLDGVSASGENTNATVEGNVSATTGSGVSADSGGNVSIHGNVTAAYRGISAYGWTDGGGTVHVYGDVTASVYYGVEASAASTVVIEGDIESKKGLCAVGESTTITINGDSTTTDASEYGATATQGGEILLNGELYADAAHFILVGDEVMEQGTGSVEGKYIVFSDGVSKVRMCGYEFFVENCEAQLSDNWSVSAEGWSFISPLSSPAAVPHSGGKVARFNSYSLTSGTDSRLYLNDRLNLSVGTDYRLEFWMYHDNSWSGNNDRITAQISIDGGATWTDLQIFSRYSDTVGWKKESINLSDYVGQTDVRIAFFGISAYGSNIYIDDISVSHKCLIDGCDVTEAYGGIVSSREIDGETFFEISSAKQLAHINEHMDLNYIQTADIDLSEDYSAGWTPIGGYGDPEDYCNPEYFTGKYDGNGYEIQNLYCLFNVPAQNACHAGVFAYIEGTEALVRDLTVTVAGASLTCSNYADFGAIAASVEGGTIENCDVIIKGDVITVSPNGDVGGIASSASAQYDGETETYIGEISDCTVTFLSGSFLTDGWSKWTGGIVGRSYAAISDCSVAIGEGETIKAPMVGGIAGAISKYVTVSDCNVSGAGSIAAFPQHLYDIYIGGIAGYTMESEILNCRNEVKVDASNINMLAETSSAYAGGITGYLGSGSLVKDSENLAEVLVTAADNVVDNFGAETEPSGSEYVYGGGIAGYVNGFTREAAIENCENRGNVTAINLIPTLRAYAGGIAGHLYSDDGDNAGVIVSNCANLGSDKAITAEGSTAMAGGIAASSTYGNFEIPNITIKNCYNQASVYSESNGPAAAETFCVGVVSGGIVGAAGEITVNYCYSTADDVSAVNEEYGDVYEGGIVGLLYNTAASQNYCETNANVTKAAGGIVSGMNIIGESDKQGYYECASVANLKTKSFYGSGWSWYVGGALAPDYYSADTPWRMTAQNTYPVLKGQAYTQSTPTGGTVTTYYTISASANKGGVISPSGDITVAKQESKKFTIVPNSGFVISDVIVDGKSVGKVSEYTFSSIKDDHEIKAVFMRVERPSDRFTDVESDAWYGEGLDFVLSEGLFKGTSDTSFEPNSGMTRAMLVTVLHRLEKMPGTNSSHYFRDVLADDWYTGAVSWADERGIVKGYGSDRFGTNDNISREQLAVILYRFAEYKGIDISASADLSGYADMGEVSDWALKAMKWAVAEGLITGTDLDELQPSEGASRAQVAVILKRFIEKFVK